MQNLRTCIISHQNNGGRSRTLRRLALTALAATVIGCRADTTSSSVPSKEATRPLLQETWNGSELICPPAHIEVFIDRPVLPAGQQTQAYFETADLRGGSLHWESSHPAVATVSRDRGTVTAVRPGYSCIRIIEESFDPPRVRYGQVRVASPGLAVSPTSLSLTAGATQQLTLLAAVSFDGSPIPSGTITWGSYDDAIASVDRTGLVRAKTAGSTGITVTLWGRQRTIPVTVRPAVSISGPSSIIAAGTYTWRANVSGGSGTYSYRWRYSLDRITWANVGTNSPTYSKPVRAGRYTFHLGVTVTSSAGWTASGGRTVTVNIEGDGGCNPCAPTQ